MSLQSVRLRIFVLLVCLLPVASPAQESVDYSEKAEQMFKDGLAFFSAGSYRDAVTQFDRVTRDFPACQRVTAAWVMKGKAYFRMEENLEAARTLKTFLAKYPSSTYTSDAEVTLGDVYQRIGRVEEAVQSYASAWRRLPLPIPSKLWREIVAALDSTIDQSISVTTLERMVSESRLGGERAYYWLKIAEKEAARENIVAATVALDTLSFRYPDNSFRERIALLKSRITLRSAVRLGALLPLMRTADPSAMKEVGNEVYDGVLYAMEEYAMDPSARVKVSLETKDTERDPKIAARGVEEFAANKDVVGIIGPVFTTTTTAAAGPATARGIPLVSPTANGTGIAAAGPYVFQANPDYEIRGRAMARFAVAVKGFRTVAVLAPSDTYAKAMAESFIAEATSLGARVLATSWYQHDAMDLKPQLSSIRRAGMLDAAEPSISFAGKMKSTDLMRFAELGVPVRRIDSLMNKGSVVSLSWLIGPISKSTVDSLGINVVYDESKVDSLQYPVTGIQALYVPIGSPEEIGVVSSQVVYFNFQTQVLGSGEWNNFLELNANKRYCGGVMFEADTFIDSNSVSYNDFLVGFSARMKKRPSRNALMGYDTARLMMGLIQSGATSREALAKGLAGVHDYQGLHSKIGFTPGRVNMWISVLRYDADAVQKVDEVKVDAWSEAERHTEQQPRR
jgi:ABC-type branched-subunit amino acid transport system substrate-binding protein